MDRAWVYLVTGGCGFLGEKIVELLSQQDYIKEVRVFDSVAREEVKKFTTATTLVTVTKGDLRDYNLLLATMQGVDVVIHTAAVVDYRNTMPFWEMRAINVGGTENVLRACCALDIPYVVHTSSISAVGPNTLCEPMFRGNEDTKYSGEVELPYGKTKAMAEKLVFEANGKKLSNGGKLTTCIIRANTVYGEKATFLRELYLSAKARNGVMNYLEPENTERNYTVSALLCNSSSKKRGEKNNISDLFLLLERSLCAQLLIQEIQQGEAELKHRGDMHAFRTGGAGRMSKDALTERHLLCFKHG
ncbi:3 beta-hydroxysteroid dehydrogenase/Delta 5--_4-isomerase type 2-like isoform X2 [Patagioenas fasciata]|uniref:3 beta-hydroxysteroid dehydrogenase/Delta 5-->4-isomerase type 2-like isoform X2 n=1 Tax=Patagioenas fasciata TaxID=372321 RepID=UPI003A98F0C9